VYACCSGNNGPHVDPIDSKTLQEIMELCRKGDLERATAMVKSIHALRYVRCKQDVHDYIRSKGYTVVPEPFVDHIDRFCDSGDSRRAIIAIAQHEKRNNRCFHKSSLLIYFLLCSVYPIWLAEGSHPLRIFGGCAFATTPKYERRAEQGGKEK
jgi:hypothetical protein